MIVELGNVAAKQARLDAKGDPVRDENGQVIQDALPEPRVTRVAIPDSYTLAEAFVCITSPQGVWANHSDSQASWVYSDSPGLQSLLAEHFNCPQGYPEDLEETHHTFSGPPGVGPDGPINPPADEAAPVADQES